MKAMSYRMIAEILWSNSRSPSHQLLSNHQHHQICDNIDGDDSIESDLFLQGAALLFLDPQ